MGGGRFLPEEKHASFRRGDKREEIREMRFYEGGGIRDIYHYYGCWYFKAWVRNKTRYWVAY